MVVIKEKKNDFDFNWSKNFDENLRYETEFIIKSIESLAENKIKNEIEQLLPKHGNNIHEHQKQQNEWTTSICS